MMDAEMMGLNGLAADPNWILDPGRDYPRLAWEGTVGEPIPEPVIDWLDGSGTAEAPYQIANVSQLQLISKASLLTDRCFELVNSLDLVGLVWGQAVIPYFDGRFDGNGHVLSHLVIEGQNNLGVFGILGPNTEISALGLEEVDIKGKNQVGGIAGYNGGVIISCYSTGTVRGESRASGLVGNNSGTIASCYSTGTVRGNGDVGGLVGYNSGDITSSYSAGIVAGFGYIGGLVARNSGTITLSLWDIETSGQSGSAAGTGLTTAQMLDINTFIEAGWDFVDESQNGTEDTWFMPTGNYPGLTWSQANYTKVPEVVGMTEQQAKDTLQVQGLSASLIYRFDDTVSDGYVLSQDHKVGQELLIGTPVSLVVAVAIAEGGTEEDPYHILNARQLMALGETPLFYDMDFVLCADIDLSGYAFERAIIAPDVNDDDSGYQGTEFTGSFDGQGYVISHLNIEGVDYLGLFGRCASNARISNLGLDAVNVNSVGKQIAGLAGNNSGMITSCYSTGSVSGDYYVDSSLKADNGKQIGGLVGDNSGMIISSYSTGIIDGFESVGGLVGDNSGTIISSYSTETVGSNNYRYLVNRFGGLVGDNSGAIMSSYSTGFVVGCEYVGGLVGDNYRGTITSSYSTGFVAGHEYVGGLVGRNCYQGRDRIYGTITSSFWDIETSGLPDGDNGTGLTTTEMQTASTFLDAGWDFVGESENGPNDVWTIADGLDYPRLAWELYDGQVTVELGQVFPVTLESNPSTGYGWEWIEEPNSIVEQIGQAEFISRATDDPFVTGAGGWEIFTFQAVRPGRMPLELIYRRPWEEGIEPLNTFSLQVTVP